MADLFDAVAGLRKAARLSPVFAPRQKTVLGPSLTPSLDAASYTRDPIYRAERRFNRKISTPFILREIEEMQIYADAVLQRAQEMYSRATWAVIVRKSDQQGLATHQSGIIQVPGPIRQVTLLHELAHHLVGAEQGHGQVFVDAFLFLIEQEMGADTRQKMVDELN